MDQINSSPLTISQFKKCRGELSASPREAGSINAFTFAIERNEHEIARLENLIQEAGESEGVTILSRIAGWKRELEKQLLARDRFRALQLETSPFPPASHIT